MTEVSEMEAFCYTQAMNLEYPYQLTTFIDIEPKIGESVYYGERGWFPQIALKRRFKAMGISEAELIEMISHYCKSRTSFIIQTGKLVKPERMPVRVLEVDDLHGYLIDFHKDFISYMEKSMSSRYPDRDGVNYQPHVTAEFNGQMVIDDKKFTDKLYEINRVFLLKDVDNENSVACESFDLN